MKQLVKERQFSCRIIVIYMYNGLYKLEQRIRVASASWYQRLSLVTIVW